MPSFTPTYTAANVLTGQMKLYTVALTSAAQTVTPPADTLATGALWPTTPTAWNPVGATEAGSTIAVKRTTDAINIEEQITNIDERTKMMSVEVDLELSEDTFETMKLAFGGATTTATAAATGVPAKNTMVINTDLTYYAVGFESVNQYGFWRRCIIPRCVSIANTKTQYVRSKKQRTYTVAIKNICAPELIQWSEMTAAAL